MKRGLLILASAGTSAILPVTAAGMVDPTDPGPHAVRSFTYEDPAGVSMSAADFQYDVGAPAPAPVEFVAEVVRPDDHEPYPMVMMMHGAHATCYDPLFDEALANSNACANSPSPEATCPYAKWVCEDFGSTGVYDCGCTDANNAGCMLLRYEQVAGFSWPCDSPFLQWAFPHDLESIPSYLGYAYLAQTLASHGYVVVSIAANGIWGQTSSSEDFAIGAGAKLLRRHLDEWTNNAGLLAESPVDMSRIGLLGHSRGGEASAVLAQDPGPHAIDAAMLVGPTYFSAMGDDERITHSLHDVATAVVAPYCDGDVTEIPGVHYHDFAEPSSAPRHLLTTYGANHNYYNVYWTETEFPHFTQDDFVMPMVGSAEYLALQQMQQQGVPVTQASFNAHVQQALSNNYDAGCGYDASLTSLAPGRLSPAQQRESLEAYGAAFFRYYLGGADDPDASDLGALLRGEANGTPDVRVDVAVTAPDGDRLDLSAPTTNGSCSGTNASGQLDTICLDFDLGDVVSYQGNQRGVHDSRDPHYLPRGIIQYSDGSSAVVPLDHLDASEYDALQVRFTVDFQLPPTKDTPQFLLTLVDGAGGRASAQLHGTVPPGGTYATTPKMMLETERISLPSLAGVDLSDLVEIRFEFDGASGSGWLFVSDLSLERATAIPPGGDGGDGADGPGPGDDDDDGTGDDDDDDDDAETGDVPEDHVGAPGFPSVPRGGDEGCGCTTSRPTPIAWTWSLAMLALIRRRARYRSEIPVAPPTFSALDPDL